MILKNELLTIAREAGVTDSLIEKDYCLGWLLKGISERNNGLLVFKGGTALRKIYFENFRISEDLDFTLLKNINEDILGKMMLESCQLANELSGIEFNIDYFSQTLNDERGAAWEAKITYFGPRNPNRANLPKIKVDLTTFEKVHSSPIDKEIFHPFTDKFSAYIPTYRLEEIAAEKLRTILQRSFPRDIFDAWYILKQNDYRLDKNLIRDIFKFKCSYKEIDTNWESFKKLAGRPQINDHWLNSLKKYYPTCPEFEEIKQELFNLCKEYFNF